MMKSSSCALIVLGALSLCLADATSVVQLDDGDAGVSRTPAVSQGTYQPCLADALGGMFLHDWGRAKGEASVSYELLVPEDGCYKLEEYHPGMDFACSRYLPTAVKIEVLEKKSDTSMDEVAGFSADTSRNGGKWNELGQVALAKGRQYAVRSGNAGTETNCDAQKHGGACFWVTDGFRATRVGDLETCAAPKSTSMESLQKNARRSVPAPVAVQDFQVETTILENGEEEVHARFGFEPEVGGCYIVEERHPNLPELTAKVPYKVNYCMGKSTVAEVDHTDSRHEMWNYLTHLPFFTGMPEEVASKTGVLVPRRLVSEGHAFRYRYVGRMCSAKEAEVHRIDLRITADFSGVRDWLPEFKTALLDTIARSSQLPRDRLAVNRVRQGSVLAEITFLPAPGAQTSAPTASAALENVEMDLAKGGLKEELCSLAGDGGDGCGVEVMAKGRVQPLTSTDYSGSSADDEIYEELKHQNEEKEENEEEEAYEKTPTTSDAVWYESPVMIYGLVLLAVALSSIFVLAYLRFRYMKKQAKKTVQEAAKKNANVDNDVTIVPGEINEKVGSGAVEPGFIHDDTSTISPKDMEEDICSEISHQIPSELNAPVDREAQMV